MLSIRVSISQAELDKLARKVEDSSSYPTLIATLNEALGENPRRQKPGPSATDPGTEYCNRMAIKEAQVIAKELRLAPDGTDLSEIVRKGLRQAEVSEAVHRLEC